ncbi:RiPP maturation radical SAM C-methyltransferase [Actinoplanes teichomyceticus]|uniref:Ribosomal peptide maturation radical SAM protein 1 n=1 Tax=Actinoplanes teichomyceticus TaxID=1867 RepID=A0A561VLQ0_ACTTI|nr:RiPP maturation radical SAM C-methyltransferase [Actinoplanes teichomyceticus]TWG12535.1 ribosomal peptide maturation radical SAM protein 1 [Actinoplanes teichomyceticus]GIF13900.1 RiPP maturation radical SAM protein 1 [Actinoplanes teichomyceticus]
MKITLVGMPWATIATPSLALGILARRIADAFPQADLTTVYANIDFADWMDQQGGYGSAEFNFFSLQSYFMGCGDWVFSSALYDDPQWRVDEFTRIMTGRISDRQLETSLRLHRTVPAFVDAMAHRIVADGPDLVGATSTFQQNVASLALLRRIKQLAPATMTVMGGANCDGPQGEALHRNFDCLDYVVRGEAERTVVQLVEALHTTGRDDLSGIAGLCWRRDGASVSNPPSRQLLSPAEIPTPDFDPYFERFRRSRVQSWFEPVLVVEGARGCWWGEKHHCTFCGLNGSAMTFRSKSPHTYLEEILHLAGRHHVLDFYAVDNILEMSFLDSVLSKLAEAPFDLRMQYEVKSNMTMSQIVRLRDAGVVSVQPGIENLSSRVLKIMDKGVSGTHNVRFLRDAESNGMSVAWNYLYGFPGEAPEDYEPIMEQLPALHHLHPPTGANRIALERFSPYFDRPELGFAGRRPHWQYSLIYDLPDRELADLAYLFETDDQGIDAKLADRLESALEEWSGHYVLSRLSYADDGARIRLVNSRPGFAWRELTLSDPTERALFHALADPRSLPHLVRLAGGPDAGWPGERVAELLQDWRRLGLIFVEADRAVRLATEDENQLMLRIRHETDTSGGPELAFEQAGEFTCVDI